MALVRHIFLVAVAGAVLLSLALPASAQESREAELRAWFDGLPRHRQNELQKRYRALKQLPRERQDEMLKAAREGRPILTEQQRAKLREMRKLSYLERVRLYTAATELQALRRTRNDEVRVVMELEPAERNERLREMLQNQRLMLFLRGMPVAERAELMRKPPAERDEVIRSLYEADSRARLEQLEGFHPRVAELREAARTGDRDARRQLRSLTTDLKTLDQLVQRLEPERRAQVMKDLRELGIDASAEAVRKALHSQWQDEMKRQRPNRQRPEFKPGERNGNRPPQRRRE